MLTHGQSSTVFAIEIVRITKRVSHATGNLFQIVVIHCFKIRRKRVCSCLLFLLKYPDRVRRFLLIFCVRIVFGFQNIRPSFHGEDIQEAHHIENLHDLGIHVNHLHGAAPILHFLLRAQQHAQPAG